MSISIAAFSYATAAAAFLCLSVLLLTRWRRHPHGPALALPCVLTSFWALAASSHAPVEISSSLLMDVLEILKNAGWTIFLVVLLAPVHQPATRIPFSVTRFGAVIAALYFLLVLAALDFFWNPGLSDTKPAFTVAIMVRLALAIIGMFLVEQLYRNTAEKERWSIKHACLGIGGMFAYDIYLYSDAMLFRNINPEIWAARGLICALTVPLIGVSSARNPRFSLGISVSRRIIFHSATLIGSAVYLLAMAAAGYYLRYVGGNWGTVMEAAFLFGAVLLLAAVMFSGSARSVLKVFISKNFFSYSYDYREEWLRFTHTLSENGPELRERTIQGIAELVESPGGTLYLKREGNCFEPVANWNMSLAREAEPTEGPFCQFLEHRKWVIDLREFNSHPQRYGAMLLPEWLRNSTKARLVVPLNLHGSLFGFVVLAHPRSTFQLNWEILDLLKIAGRQAASYIAQQEASNALFVARQFESFNRMSTFVVHDLKNLVSQLSLLLSNAEKHKGNPEFQADMVDTVDHSIRKMKLLLEKLSRGSETEQPVPLLIDGLLQQAVAAKSHAEPKPVLEIKDCGLVVLADFARLERVIGHIIQNAIEATARDGQVVIRLAKQNDSVVVELEDTGQGMSEEFIRERLFKPFESTKSGGMGIGVFESRAYIRELGGQIKVFSRQSVGTTFRLILPLFDYEAQVAKRFG